MGLGAESAGGSDESMSAHYEFESVVVLGVDIHHGQSKASTQPRRSSAESGRRGQTRGGSPASQ